jgi:hypothetical protein
MFKFSEKEKNDLDKAWDDLLKAIIKTFGIDRVVNWLENKLRRWRLISLAIAWTALVISVLNLIINCGF